MNQKRLITRVTCYLLRGEVIFPIFLSLYLISRTVLSHLISVKVLPDKKIYWDLQFIGIGVLMAGAIAIKNRIRKRAGSDAIVPSHIAHKVFWYTASIILIVLIFWRPRF